MYLIRRLLILILCNCSLGLFAQNGSNGFQFYDPVEDYAMLITPLGQVSESSGLLYSDGKLWTFGDSGNPPDIFSVDTTTGNIIQIVHVQNYPNTDWEDITADSNFIYIADAGNNLGDRTDLKILKISKSGVTDVSSVSVTSEAISFSYDDQTGFTPDDHTNFDCESIISMGDSLYLFTKDRGDYKTRVYALPKIPGDYHISPYTTFDAEGMVCGADYDPSSNRLVLIGYESSKYNSFIWMLDGFNGNRFFSGNRKKVMIGNSSAKWQTEGIAFRDSSNLYISCESTNDIESGLYSVTMNRLLAATVINHTGKEPEIQCFPNPAHNYVTITCSERIQNLALVDLTGKSMFEEKINNNNYQLSLEQFRLYPGTYLLKVRTNFNFYVMKLEVY